MRAIIFKCPALIFVKVVNRFEFLSKYIHKLPGKRRRLNFKWLCNCEDKLRDSFSLIFVYVRLMTISFIIHELSYLYVNPNRFVKKTLLEYVLALKLYNYRLKSSTIASPEYLSIILLLLLEQLSLFNWKRYFLFFGKFWKYWKLFGTFLHVEG